MSGPNIDIKALASLARLEVSDEEVARLEKELPSILSFVETVQKAAVDTTVMQPEHRNILRADENPHESGLYTEALLKAAPMRECDQVAVMQVLKKK